VSPLDRAKAAHAAAEAADHPRDKAALRAAAAAWERIAGPGVSWSHLDLRRDLTSLKRHVAQANGPFKAPPQPPKAPSPSQATPDRAELTARIVKSIAHLREEPAAIEF
jgi:hypothetical protein